MLQKQAVPINFAQGLDTKTDPFQVELGKFLSLQNSIFTKAGLLQKRNGYAPLAALPDATSTFLTTFGNNLTAIGTNLEAYSAGSATWISKGNIQPLSLSVLQTGRSALNQTQCDSVIASNGLVCTVYTEVNNGTADYKYTVQDSTTGQNIINPTLIPVSSGVVTGAPRVFLLGGYFVIVFTNVITAVSHLQYVAVSVSNPTVVTANTDLASAYISATTVAWDALVIGNKLFFAYNTTSGGQQIKFSYMTSSFSIATPQTFAGSIATMMGMSADQTNPASPAIYLAFYDSASSTGFAVAFDQNLNTLMTATQIITATVVKNITATAQNGVMTGAWEVAGSYSYDSGIPTNHINSKTVTLPNSVTTGTVGSLVTVARSVGLASKAFLMNSVMYFLAAYQSTFQPTYFLIDISGHVISKIAYENGGGYLLTGLPKAQVSGTSVSIPYLFKDLIESTNTTPNSNGSGAPNVNHIYSQTGCNLATFTFTSATLAASEIGSNLNMSGGMLWAYDGQTVNEQGFHLFPDNVEATWSATGGAIHAQPDGATNTNAYAYQVTYEWTDAKGNIFRSAPSIPIFVTTTGSGTAGSITVNVPNLRLTYKADVKIVIYRWSVANQTYYQVTSITAPTLNSKTTDSTAFVDTLADASVIGNSIIYTTGGVVEDIGGPAATAITLFDDRLWLIDAEDKNLLWYSKQVIEGTPVEMSDLLTFYVAPSTGAQGSTGNMQCLFPMDDKLIIFKKNAIYYINGTGPDNTGSNNNYSQPIFITSTVGCSNQNSIVFMPDGLMFQSDKGIWLLGRDLSTKYIGDAVEEFNTSPVNSALTIPETTQVRFTLSNGTVLMYDYYYSQWGTFINVPAISSTLYNDLHTYISSSGAVFQETPDIYQDNGNAVLMSFTTSWIKLAGLQGYQRAYFFYLLGTYLTPHKLMLQIAYDYNSAPTQSTLIQPNNFNPAMGIGTSQTPFGQQTPYGGPGSIEQWRVFLAQQRCQAFQLTLSEIFDATLGAPAGAGLTLSGLNMVVGVKKGFRPQGQATSAGGGTNRG